MDNEFERRLDLEMEHQAVLIPQNMKAGAKAFLEKRKPIFDGSRRSPIGVQYQAYVPRVPCASLTRNMCFVDWESASAATPHEEATAVCVES